VRRLTDIVIGYGVTTLFVVGVLVLSFAMFVTIKARADERIPQIEKPAVYRHGPPIPKCDKELWLRIKDGCKDETNENEDRETAEPAR